MIAFLLAALMPLFFPGCRDQTDPGLTGPAADSAVEENPYAHWPNGPSPDPAFFPIGVWLQDPEMLAAVAAINHQLIALAPVLNSQTVDRAQVVSAGEGVPIDLMAKHHEGDLYLFAVAMRPGETRGTFQVSGLRGSARAEVLGEGRNLELKDGAFEDDFTSYGVHLYKIAGD